MSKDSLQGTPITLPYFFDLSYDTHGNTYDYRYVEKDFTNGSNAVRIICQIHGVFWQSPRTHMNGSGCKKCGYIRILQNHTSKQEEETYEWLCRHNFTTIRQYALPFNVFTDSWVYMDFFLPDIHTFVEVNGKQHYEWVPYFHPTKEKFLDQQHRDHFKIQWCQNNNFRLVIIKYDQNVTTILAQNIA